MRERKPLSPGVFFWGEAGQSCRSPLELLPGPPLPTALPWLSEAPGAVTTPTHAHPPRQRLPRRKEAGEEADKKDSFCLDTNILVISTDGMRNTKKSTWQFRENLTKCYIFLTYLYRVFGTSTWISQNMTRPGGYASTKGRFYFRNVPFRIHKSILVIFFSLPPK